MPSIQASCAARGQLLCVFRVEGFGIGGQSLSNRLAVVRLDAQHQPQGAWTFLQTPRPRGNNDTAEDPRLIVHQGRVWVVYTLSDDGERMGPRRIHLAELLHDLDAPTDAWRLGPDKRMIYVPQYADGRSGPLPQIEKNWSPFVHRDQLHFIYKSNPLEVLRLENTDLDGPPRDVFPAPVRPASQVRIPWGYGEVRGGTPAIWEPTLGRYVTFFHSRWICSINGSRRKEHYFTGFYSFHPEPPFDIDQIYPRPLAFPIFVQEAETERSSTVVYVEGAVADGNHYLLSYGLGDTALGLLKVDRDGLLDGLRSPSQLPGPPFSEVEVQVDPVCDR